MHSIIAESLSLFILDVNFCPLANRSLMAFKKLVLPASLSPWMNVIGLPFISIEIDLTRWNPFTNNFLIILLSFIILLMGLTGNIPV